jgi:hypothetical protein
LGLTATFACSRFLCAARAQEKSASDYERLSPME